MSVQQHISKRTTRQSSTKQGTMESSQEENIKMILDQVQQLSKLSELPKQIDGLREEIKAEIHSIKESLEFSQSQLATTMVKSEEQAKTIEQLQRDLKKERDLRLALEKKVASMHHNQALAEDYTRKYNLTVQGIPETNEEICREKFLAFTRNKLKIDVDLKMDTVHRLGKPNKGKDRMMIARFLSQDDRNLVWGQRRELQGTGIYLNEDFSTVTRNKRATLSLVMKLARKRGMRASLIGDSLIVDGHKYTVDTMHTLPQEINTVATSTRDVGGNSVAFYSYLSPLSNFHKASFQIDGQWYTSSEQYFHYQKAMSVKDDNTANAILNSSDPVVIKRLGNTIRAGPGSKWNSEKLQVMKKGCLEKFKQNLRLAQFLADTQNKELIEASSDTYWGAGVGLDSPLLLNGSWSGQNKLGQILMAVREQVKTASQN